jgi:hypothetical protein
MEYKAVLKIEFKRSGASDSEFMTSKLYVTSMQVEGGINTTINFQSSKDVFLLSRFDEAKKYKNMTLSLYKSRKTGPRRDGLDIDPLLNYLQSRQDQFQLKLIAGHLSRGNLLEIHTLKATAIVKEMSNLSEFTKFELSDIEILKGHGSSDFYYR